MCVSSVPLRHSMDILMDAWMYKWMNGIYELENKHIYGCRARHNGLIVGKWIHKCVNNCTGALLTYKESTCYLSRSHIVFCCENRISSRCPLIG